jgi:septum formation protein
VPPSFILASHSPRRLKLLNAAGFEFQAIAADIDETFVVDLTLGELTLFYARRKAAAVARIYPTAVVLAADTLVALDGDIMGKPRDLKHAAELLRRLSGRVHEVCTAVCIFHFARARSTSFQEITRVRFRRLNQDKIDKYISKVNPLDKAGAYAAQGRGAEIIARIDGSFTNVVGLPMERTIPALREFGIVPRSGN